MVHKSNYPWLNSMKASAKEKRKDRVKITYNSLMKLGGAPLSTQIGVKEQPTDIKPQIAYTGFGEDNQLQPGMPTDMLQTSQGNRMVHEGEAIVSYPDGRNVVIPNTQMNQSQLQSMEQKEGIQGFQRGGQFTTPTPPPTPKPDIWDIQQPVTPPPVTTPQLGGPGMVDTSLQDLGIQNIQPEVTGPTVGMPEFERLPPEGKVMPPPIELPIGKVMPPPKPPEVEPEPEVGPTAEDLKYQQALARLKKLADMGDPQAQKIYQQEMDRLKGEEQAAAGALEQQMAQMDMTGREAMTERAMAARGAGAQEVELAAALRKGELDRAFQASMALPAATLAGMQFELGKEQWQKVFDMGKDQWDYTKKMDMVNALIAQGGEENFKQAAEMLGAMFPGMEIDFDNALMSENAAAFSTGMSNIENYIKAGMDWETALEAMMKDGTFDMLNMEEDDVKKMYDQMKLAQNPIFQMDNMLQGAVDAGLMTQDQADEIMEFFLEGFKPEGKYVVTDKDGNEIGAFDTQGEADAFMKDNPDSTSNFVKDYKEDTDPELTPVETYGTFESEQIPDEAFDFVTQEMWKDLGSPETWEDFEKALSERIDKLPTEDLTGMSTKDRELLVNALKMGNEKAQSKFGVSEDHDITRALNLSTKFAKTTTGKGQTAKVEKLPSLEDVEKAIGKIIIWTDANGVEHISKIDAAEVRETGPLSKRGVWITLTNIDTGQPYSVWLRD